MFAFGAAVVALAIVGLAIWHYWYVAAGVLVALLAVRRLDRSGWAARRREAAQKRREARLRSDADEQHQAYLYGDVDKAAHGRFPVGYYPCGACGEILTSYAEWNQHCNDNHSAA